MNVVVQNSSTNTPAVPSQEPAKGIHRPPVGQHIATVNAANASVVAL